MNRGFRHAPPRAGAMVESLRGIGYSTPTAIADLIDNSISAGAKAVELIFDWNGTNSRVRILDDGSGMDELELEKAMLLGDKNPLSQRSGSDLGRFGFGLKTASFSQCRRLTVASKKAGRTSCFRWDLDFLATSKGDGWYLLEGADPASGDAMKVLEEKGSGTLVIWELMDRIVTQGFGEQEFLDLLDRIESHLSMVFHRFIAGPDPRLRISINGRRIDPWDPFLTDHPATWSSPVEQVATASGTIRIQGHVLPHKDKLEPEVHRLAGGPDGWTAQQGFYIYRNERLLLAGSWLGLGQGRPWSKEEAFRLARIRVDIPNTADADWRIDIRKSVARPPVAIKARLSRLAEDTREKARRVFAHRGAAGRGPSQLIDQAWKVDRSASGIRYRIDRTHPAIQGALGEAGDLLPALQAMLRVIEETVPIQRIWLDTTETQEIPRTGFSGEPAGDVSAVMRVLYKNMIHRKGMSPEQARERLLHTDPFQNYPELISELGSDPEGIRQ